LVSLTLRDEYRLRVFQNSVLRRIFGPKGEDGAECWRRPHNEELHDPYALANIIRMIKLRRMIWAVH